MHGGQWGTLQDTLMDGSSHEWGRKRALCFRLKADGLAELEQTRSGGGEESTGFTLREIIYAGTQGQLGW